MTKAAIGEARVLAALGEVVAELRAIHLLLEGERAEPSNAKPGDELLGPSAVAALLGMDARSLRRLRSAGDAPKSVTINGRPRWRRSTVDAWLAARGAR